MADQPTETHVIVGKMLELLHKSNALNKDNPMEMIDLLYLTQSLLYYKEQSGKWDVDYAIEKAKSISNDSNLMWDEYQPEESPFDIAMANREFTDGEEISLVVQTIESAKPPAKNDFPTFEM